MIVWWGLTKIMHALFLFYLKFGEACIAGYPGYCLEG